MTSARIETLRLAVAAEGRRALQEFWKEVAEETTPLVESIDGDPDHVVVTFLWRAEGEVAGVTVEGGPGGSVPTRLQFLPGTDLWHRSWRVPTDTRCTYRFRQNVTDPGDDPGALRQLWRDLDGVRTDPYNPREVRMAGPGGRPRYRRDLVSSLLELPGAPPQPWAQARPEVRTGRVDEHELWSDVLGNERAVWVYTPPGYPADGAHYPVMVAFDGLLMVDATLALPTTLDNLGASGLVPPMVAVMVSNPDPPTRMRELPCHAPMVDFLAGELLPWVRSRYRVVTDPTRAIVGGASHGGLAAGFAAWCRPDLFGNVWSSSGSYWWRPPGDTEPEWLSRQVASGGVAPRRCYLDVGRFETGDGLFSGGPDTLACNRRFRDVLIERGSEVGYSEFSGGHDTVCWRGSLGEALLFLTREWENPR